MTDSKDFAKFKHWAEQGYKNIPVTRSLFSDLDTPVSTYLKVGNVPYSYLLESVQGGDKWARYSFIGLPAERVIKVTNNKLLDINHKSGEAKEFEVEDPIAYLREHLDAKAISPDVPELEELPRFFGGLVGYFAYECAAYTEERLRHLLEKENTLGCPHIILMHSDKIIAFDNLLGKMLLICHANLSEVGVEEAYAEAQSQLDEIENLLTSALPAEAVVPLSSADPSSDSDKKLQKLLGAKGDESGEQYRAMVKRIKEYVRAGDVMQVVPSQRMETSYQHEPFDFYRGLRTVNPAPYMFYLHLDDFQVAGASPEILTRLEHQGNKRIATARPIAGTRPRGKDEAEDLRLEQDMLADPKEIAEHLMLIDLGRNDIGRVSKAGSVKVSDQFGVERYSHVMHIVSNVTGELKDELDALDLLRYSLPAGTLSGAAKIRAMEIIAELEPQQRGIYGGALGYLGWQGNMDMCIAIRSAVIKDGKIFFQAGGGIVADSDPEREWQETLNKRGALLRVASILGLDDAS